MAKKAKKTEIVEVEPQTETMEEVVTEFIEDTVVEEGTGVISEESDSAPTLSPEISGYAAAISKLQPLG